MASQCGIQPPLGEEDVPRSLDLLEQLEAGRDVLLGGLRAQGVMQERDGRDDPRLVLPVPGVPEAREELITCGGVR